VHPHASRAAFTVRGERRTPLTSFESAGTAKRADTTRGCVPAHHRRHLLDRSQSSGDYLCVGAFLQWWILVRSNIDYPDRVVPTRFDIECFPAHWSIPGCGLNNDEENQQIESARVPI